MLGGVVVASRALVRVTDSPPPMLALRLADAQADAEGVQAV